MTTIKVLKQAKESIVRDINTLLPQLRENVSEHITSLSELESIIANTNNILMIIEDDGRVIGMATLYMIQKFSKRSGFIEDVVVDAAYRGQGLGKKLMTELINTAHTQEVKTIYLTSRPERVAANQLYQKLGFELKNTNVYRLQLT